MDEPVGLDTGVFERVLTGQDRAVALVDIATGSAPIVVPDKYMTPTM